MLRIVSGAVARPDIIYISRIKESLLDKELIETDVSGVYLEDPIFKMWFKREYMK